MLLEKAAKQALEALKRVQPQIQGALCVSDVADAIQALTYALPTARPVPPHEARTKEEKIAYCSGWWAATQHQSLKYQNAVGGLIRMLVIHEDRDPATARKIADMIAEYGVSDADKEEAQDNF